MTDRLAEYEDVLRFVVVLLGFNLLWKLCVSGDDMVDLPVAVLGLDVTPLFSAMSVHVAEALHNLCNIIGLDTTLAGTTVRFVDTKNAVRIVAGCTGIKQAFLMMMILLFSRGPWMCRLIYSVVVGLGGVYAVNILRLMLIMVVHHQYPEFFYIMHDHIMKYFFYFMIFMIWVLWNDVLRGRFGPKRGGRGGVPAAQEENQKEI